MLLQIWGYSQEFFALGKTVQTAQKLWGSTGYSGERAQMAPKCKRNRRVPLLHVVASCTKPFVSSRCTCGKKKSPGSNQNLEIII